MSNELAVLEAGLPSYLKELEVDEVTRALMGGGSSTKRISLRGGVWRMIVNGKEVAKNEERAMNVVIVNASPKVARSYYLKKWEEGAEPAMPDCWSADGDFPDKSVSMPQAKRCVDCPQNVKGSGKGDSRACRFQQRLAVVLANDIGGDVFQFVVPAKSLFGDGAPGKWPLQTYARMIGSKGIPISAVVTEMKFDTDADSPVVTFRPVRVLEKAEIEQAMEQGKSPSAIKAITMTAAESDGAKRTPVADKSEPEPKKEQEKPEASAEPAKEPEPTVRSGKEEAAAPAKRDLSKILSEWDDE